jgi:hypothetical protein
MVDATDEEIASFSERYGVLVSSGGEGESTELLPYSAWRVHAVGLETILQIAGKASAGEASQRKESARLMSSLFVPAWASRSTGARGPAPDLGGEAIATGLNDINDAYSSTIDAVPAFDTLDDREKVTAVVDALLDLSGVDVVLADDVTGPTLVASFTAVRIESLSVQDERWRVGGLLPILACAVRFHRSVRRCYWRPSFRCDGCQQEFDLKYVESDAFRRPREDDSGRRVVPFYGNHDTCRRAARRASGRASQRRYEAARRAQREPSDDSQSDSQAR